jgi:hypothetical protein
MGKMKTNTKMTIKLLLLQATVRRSAIQTGSEYLLGNSVPVLTMDYELRL